MKNAIMMVAAMGMFGGAMAEKTYVIQPVTAQVDNVCTYNPDDMTDVKGETFRQNSVAITTNANAYKANNGNSGTTVSMGAFYIFRCTKGTAWDVAPEFVKSGDIKLDGVSGNAASAGSSKLVVHYEFTTDDSYNDADTMTSFGKGDYHKAGVAFTIPAGQWNAEAGKYKGELKVTINYN